MLESMMNNHYADKPVVAYALDVWNGSQTQAQAFVNATQITYPLLMNAGTTGAAYATGNDVSFVVDGDNVIVERHFGFNESAARAAIDDALAALLTDVEGAPSTRTFSFDAVYPNPFNPSTTVTWTISDKVQDASVRVEIHDVMGRRVASLLEGRLEGGREHSLVWDGRGDDGRTLQSGTYVAMIDVDGEQLGRFITLVK